MTQGALRKLCMGECLHAAWRIGQHMVLMDIAYLSGFNPKDNAVVIPVVWVCRQPLSSPVGMASCLNQQMHSDASLMASHPVDVAALPSRPKALIKFQCVSNFSLFCIERRCTVL